MLKRTVSVVATHNAEFPNHYPAPGHVEHDVDEIWTSIATAVQAVLAETGVDPARIAAIGVTNQRETSLIWDFGLKNKA